MRNPIPSQDGARRPRPWLAALAFGLAAPGLAHAAHGHHHAAPVTRVVQLAPQSADTPLGAAARRLTAPDIADSERHGATPLVLVGSAPLATHRALHDALFVQLQSAALCGSAGCQTSVYLPDRHGWHKVLDSVSGPIAVLASAHHGMHDLLVGEHDRWLWNGATYADTVEAPALTGLRRSVERHQASVAAHGGQSPPPP